ncbi:MAG: NUDIX domain-containing protein [Streptococcaceae bacterium]|jgi:8-oxo-dGTP diphosphatase|nr:NUDIX domain-containing protein [Streptococcaceae bacterium]
MENYPTFGLKEENVEYQTRIGVHVIMSRKNNQEILIVKAPNNAYFLPGGEIEPGEDHLLAIKRELIEETGTSAIVGAALGRADEYYFSRNRNTHFFNPIYVYAIDSWETIGERTEAKSTPEWFAVDEAIDKLKRGSHKWGVEQWLTLIKN